MKRAPFHATLPAALLAVLVAAGPAAAQDPDTAEAPVDSVVVMPEVPVVELPVEADTVREPISPGGAFLRSMAVPGWGQSAFGSYVRGGVFFSGWAANWFMLFRTYTGLEEARSRYDRRADHLVDSLLAGTENPDSLREALENTNLLETVVRDDEIGDDLRMLVRARRQQREDWVAWSIFWLLASGIDGFVTAHLSDFPADVDLEPNREGSVSLRFQVPVGGPDP